MGYASGCTSRHFQTVIVANPKLNLCCSILYACTYTIMAMVAMMAS
jgi:hypothetical protein